MKTATYGSWVSAVTAEMMARGNTGLAEPAISDDTIYWLESRPWEQGRCVLVEYRNGQRRDLLPEDYSARSRAQEYGGGAWTLAGSEVLFVNDSDQVIYRLNPDNPDAAPLALTPADGRRYADLHYDPHHRRVLAVCEDHRQGDQDPPISIVAIDLSAAGRIRELASGDDFYAYPRLSPDGSQLCWISWNHPHMPWDATGLKLASLNDQGIPAEVQTLVEEENTAVFQPGWAGDGSLVFVADFGEFWNLYRWREGSEFDPITTLQAECGLPLWNYNMSTWAPTNDGGFLCCANESGFWRLLRIRPDGSLDLLDSPFTHLTALAADNSRAVALAASPLEAATIIRIDAREGRFERLHCSASTLLQPDQVSRPLDVEFPTTDEATAHAFFYPPQNPDFCGPKGEQPPLIVLCHGGPTGATSSALNLRVQFWTSRGFAVMDVNYRGSTGYGKTYRRSLRGQWGIADVADACRAAEYAVAKGWADGNKLIIRGSSAGGFTVLAALAFNDTFDAGCCLYGIGELQALAEDTHKFEARYLDSLVAPWPEGREEYLRRSPLNHIDGLSCPVIFFQGLRDKVVLPEQTRAMARALHERGIATWYQTYAEEGHGFRTAATIIDSYQRELAFYSQVFGFPNSTGIELDLNQNIE